MITLTLDRIAHGGHCVARHDGQVVFVRHGIPGETVEARITGRGKGDRYLFADAVTVIDPSPDRVTPDCPVAGECGGCDFQHITEARQRQLKAQVITEQLARLGGVELPVTVQAVPRAEMGWRTRARFVADRDGRWGLRRHSSHDVVPVESCPIATTAVNDVLMGQAPGAPGDHLPIVDPGRARRWCGHPPAGDQARGRPYVRGPSRRFLAGPPEGARSPACRGRPACQGVPAWWDLYCGAGLFAGVLAEPGQRVAAVEGTAARQRLPGATLADRPGCTSCAVTSVNGFGAPAAGRPPWCSTPRSGAGRGSSKASPHRRRRPLSMWRAIRQHWGATWDGTGPLVGRSRVSPASTCSP